MVNRMKNKWRRLLAVGVVGLLSASTAHAQNENAAFNAWLAGVRAEAAQVGIPDSVLDDALTDIFVDESVIRLDRKQPESTISFTTYLERTVTESRVAQGKEMMDEYGDLLKEIGAYYQVQPQFIVALWGVETSYGANQGGYPIVSALATLAYEGRRAEFFRKELLTALRILAEENMDSASFVGSWAGAMGNCQFMPSSYTRFAVDWDKDGKRDIWNSLPDTFASIANYLHSSGWNGGVNWGGQIHAPEHFIRSKADLNTPRHLREWAARGVTLPDGSPLPDAPHAAYAVYPGERGEGAYLVSDNYKVLLQWNRSRYFATSVGILADRIGEEG